MDVIEKIRILGDAAKYDSCASSASSRKPPLTSDRIGSAVSCGICHSFTEDGRCVSLFKVLQSNACSYDCKYCINAVGGNSRKTSFEPQELARSFMHLYMRNYVEGLFLSSAVQKDPDLTTEKMIDTVKLIRNKYRFHGYVHFKVLPGTSQYLVRQASELSDRMSVNLEAPNSSRLSEISSVKDFKIDIIRRQAWIKRMRIPSGQTTQMVVGSSDETDMEILKTINWEYNNVNLKRGYYSSFIPVPKTPLEFKDRTPLLREHRLFNIDFMMRKYQMKLDEFKRIMKDGMLPKEDPKLALAKETFDGPIEINNAGKDELVRVPGIGPLSAQRIIKARKSSRITRYEELHNIGVVLKRAKPFIKVDGKYQTRMGVFT